MTLTANHPPESIVKLHKENCCEVQLHWSDGNQKWSDLIFKLYTVHQLSAFWKTKYIVIQFSHTDKNVLDKDILSYIVTIPHVYHTKAFCLFYLFLK